MANSKRRWWQFRLATWLAIFLFCTSVAALLRLRWTLATLPLGRTTALDVSGVIFLAAGIVACLATTFMALAQSRPEKKARLMRSGLSGAIGGIAFVLITGWTLGPSPLRINPPGTYLIKFVEGVALIWWPICGAFVGIAVELVGCELRSRRFSREALLQKPAADEINQRPTVAVVERPRPWFDKIRKALPSGLTSLFIHATALMLIALGLVQIIQRPL